MLFGANDDLLQRIINKHEMSLILFSSQRIEWIRQVEWYAKEIFEASVITGKSRNIISWLDAHSMQKIYFWFYFMKLEYKKI